MGLNVPGERPGSERTFFEPRSFPGRRKDERTNVPRRRSLLSLAWGGNALAQNTATLQGFTKDATGGRLPGVSLEIRNVDTGFVRNTVTDNGGRIAMASFSRELSRSTSAERT